MIIGVENNFIIQSESNVYRYTNDSCLDAAKIFKHLNQTIECTYLIYMYEDLNKNEKYVYSSNWGWQDLLIGERLINDCPVFLAAFRYLENRNIGKILLPWNMAPPSNKQERNVCGLRSEFNIANGIGYGAKGYGVRESLAFGGDSIDKNFYKNFTSDPNLFNSVLMGMRRTILLKNHEDKIISHLLSGIQ